MNFQLQERFTGNKINCLSITIWTNDENFMCPDQSKTGHVTDKCIKLIRKRWIHLRRHRRRMWWRGREVTTVVSYWWLFCFIGSANNHDDLLLRMKTTRKVFTVVPSLKRWALECIAHDETGNKTENQERGKQIFWSECLVSHCLRTDRPIQTIQDYSTIGNHITSKR